MKGSSYIKIVFLAVIYHCITPDPVQMNTHGENPISIALTNDAIFTVSSIGILLSNNDASFISNLEHLNSSSTVELTKLPNGKIASYNGVEISWYTKEGAYERQISYQIGNRPNIMDYTAIITYDNSKFLIATTENNNLNLLLVDTATLATLKHALIAVQSDLNPQCVKQVIGNGVFCSIIQTISPEILYVYSLDMNLHITNQITVTTLEGRILRSKHIDGVIFSFCYLTFQSNAYCCLFNEATMTITNPSLIAKRTDNYNKLKFDTGVLSKTELLFVFVDNSNMRINAQKISYTGGLIGSIYSFPMTGSGYITTLSYLHFGSGKRGVVYGKSGEDIFFQELNMPSCLDYCRSVGYSQTTTIDLTLYSTTNKVRFTALPAFGVIQSRGIPVVILIDHTTTALEYVSLSVPSIGTAKYRSVNENGLSTECSMNIFIGEKANCPCPNNLFLFQDLCVLNCPDYTYTDSINKKCINCASLQKYLYLGECKIKDNLPESVFVSNSNYNVVEDCTAPCHTCVDSATKCLSCVPGQVCSLLCSSDYIYLVAEGKCVPCYESCSSCSQSGDINTHHCLSCKAGFETIPNKLTQCFVSCRNASSSRWFIDSNDHYFCISSTVCPSFSPIYISDNNQCVESCSKSSSCIKCQQTTELLFNYQNTCVSQCPFGYIQNEKTTNCDKSAGLDIGISDKPLDDELGDLNTTIIPGKNITIIRGDNYTVEIYNSTEKGGNLALSQIDFSKCEKILRKEYSIADGDILIFVKIDLDRIKELTNQVEYEVYDSKRNKLNLKLCDETTIDVTYYIKNSSVIDVETAKYYEGLGIDIHNPNDPFFVDICFPFTTENGTDIILRDRLKDIYKNISLCEESCSYKEIDLEKMTVTCTCDIKPEVNTQLSTNFFTQAVTTVFTNSNFMVVTCYNLVFNRDILLTNVGFWVYLVLMVLHLPNWVYVFTVGVAPIRRFVLNSLKAAPNKATKKGDDYISTIIEEGTNAGDHVNSDLAKFRESRRNSQISINTNKYLMGSNGEIKAYSPKQQRKSNFLTERRTDFKHRNSNDTQLTLKELNNNSNSLKNMSSNEGIEQDKEKIVMSPYLLSNKNEEKTYSTRDSKSKSKTEKPFIVYSNRNQNHNNQTAHSEKIQLTQAENNKITLHQMAMNTELTLNTMTSEIKHIDKIPSKETLDDFAFKEALVFDKRSFFRQLYICIKNRHSVMVTFIKECILELRSILIIVYLFENCIDFAFNAFFFTDNLISKRYNYEGSLYFLFTLQTNFISSLASFAASTIICSLLNLLSTSKAQFETIVSTPDQKKRKELLIKSLKCFKIKLAFFFTFEVLFVLFFWYYATAFCAVYHSSQWNWLTGGFMTFGLGLLFPILICFCIISLRYLALLHQKECLFKFAQWCFRF